MPGTIIVDGEKLATEVKNKSNTLVSQLTARPYNSQKTLMAVGALRFTLNKIVPNRTWGFWRGVLIGLICGLGIWYAFAHNIITLPQ